MDAGNLTHCANCGKPARARCARCQSSVYCDRNCQIAHWSAHKKPCRELVYNSPKNVSIRRANWFMQTTPRISGNIFMMASHRYASVGLGVIFAEISETIDEFMKGNSIHFAHLSFAPIEEFETFPVKHYDKQLNIPKPVVTADDVVVVYVLQDYHVLTRVTPDSQVNLATLKNNCGNPPDDWSVMFEI